MLMLVSLLCLVASVLCMRNAWHLLRAESFGWKVLGAVAGVMSGYALFLGVLFFLKALG